MKKWKKTILPALLLVFALTCPAAAETESAAANSTTEELSQSGDQIPDQRLLPLLVDEADLLTDEEEENLLTVLDEISERQTFDVAVVTVNGLEGKTAMEFADDFYDYNGYGAGSERDGILLLISMEERDWWISTCGYGITAFTDAGLDYISDKFLSDLSDGNYEKAFLTYAELCDGFVTQARTGEPYDTGNLPKEPFDPIWILIDLAIGFGIGYVIAFRKKEKLISVRKKYTATDYKVPGSFCLTVNTDHFLRKYVTSRYIVESSKPTSSGSTTHTSSSGTTHGGTGGKF